MTSYTDEKALPGLEEFVPEFLEDRFTELEELKIYDASSDFEMMRKMAHKWKGFCKPYGFNHLETLSNSLETASIAQEKAKTTQVLDNISEYLISKKSTLNGTNK